MARYSMLSLTLYVAWLVFSVCDWQGWGFEGRQQSSRDRPLDSHIHMYCPVFVPASCICICFVLILVLSLSCSCLHRICWCHAVCGCTSSRALHTQFCLLVVSLSHSLRLVLVSWLSYWFVQIIRLVIVLWATTIPRTLSRWSYQVLLSTVPQACAALGVHLLYVTSQNSLRAPAARGNDR